MSPTPPNPGDPCGEFDALLALLDTPAAAVDIASGYAVLMARVNSPEYRRRCGLVKH